MYRCLGFAQSNLRRRTRDGLPSQQGSIKVGCHPSAMLGTGFRRAILSGAEGLRGEISIAPTRDFSHTCPGGRCQGDRLEMTMTRDFDGALAPGDCENYETCAAFASSALTRCSAATATSIIAASGSRVVSDCSARLGLTTSQFSSGLRWCAELNLINS